jgi:hypothetical protein
MLAHPLRAGALRRIEQSDEEALPGDCVCYVIYYGDLELIEAQNC